MKRIITASGFVLATGLALGAMAGPASADNNADIQNITVPVCADVLSFSGFSMEGCNVVDVDDTDGITAK
ncbi:hypothetical protein [Nocardiopsis salina]|uniref:hypothetical protein n=1 Tax=Nocardiopsis salina TaxID=245836 RepID=UPI000345B673|nr:hypothetical protein [Nocardiopsis salina]